MILFRDHHSFGLPASSRFFFSADVDGGGGADPDTGGGNAGALDDFSLPDEASMERGRAQERVDGEKPPDFSSLGGSKKAAEKPESGEGASAKEKPAGGQPEKGAAPSNEPAKASDSTKKGDSQAKATEKPADTKGKQPEKQGDPAKSGQKPADGKAKGDDKPAKVPSDEEIDALHPKPGAPTHIIKDFGEMRSKMKEIAGASRTLQAENERLTAEIATLKESSGKLPDDVQEKLKQAESFQLLFDAQNNPEFRREFDDKITASTDAVFKLLEAHKLPAKHLAEIKAVAEKHGGDIDKWPHWNALLGNFKDEFSKDELKDALKARRGAVKARADKLGSLASDRQTYLKEMETRDAAQKQEWAKELEKEALRIGTGFEPAIEKDYPEGASAEVKTAIDTHNARVGEIAKAFQQHVIAAYRQDPKAIAKLAFDGARAEEFERQLTEKTAELEKKEARVVELEEQLAKIKAKGRVAHVETPAPGSRQGSDDGKIGGDGSSALRNFFSSR